MRPVFFFFSMKILSRSLLSLRKHSVGIHCFGSFVCSVQLCCLVVGSLVSSHQIVHSLSLHISQRFTTLGREYLCFSLLWNQVVSVKEEIKIASTLPPANATWHYSLLSITGK